MFWLLFWIFLKHFICDFPLQMFPYQYKNKGTYGHPGGVIHAGIHFIGMAIICWNFNLPPSLPFLDAFIHYHIDWAKMNVNAHFNLTPTTSESFWLLLGVDQFLHYLTYLFLLYVAGKV